MTSRPVEVWLFYPKNSPSASGQAQEIIGEECKKRQWAFQKRPTRLIKADGRPIGQIEPQDATNLYKRLHRARVGVWQIEHADVPKLPQPRPIASNYITLRQFVLHKAYHGKLPNKSVKDAWLSSLEEFSEWMNGYHCENEGDPRCLPFHVFSTEFCLSQLKCQSGRQHFASIHGAQSSRLDDRRLKWTRGTPHGHEPLHVAGYELTTGFHWDVAGRQKQRVSTTASVWEIRPQGYVNVYPDAHIRGNPKSAHRLYP